MKVTNVKGIVISLHYSTTFTILLVGFNAGIYYLSLNSNTSLLELIGFGLLAGIMALISIILHELMHSITAMNFGLEISEIELSFIGGMAKIKGDAKLPSDEMKIAIIGPITSLIIGCTALGLSALGTYLPLFLWGILSFIANINIVLGLFNLLPAFPMDGGRVLRAYLWKRKSNLISATTAAGNLGKYFGYGFMVWGGLQFITGNFTGLITFFIGNFLRTSATSSVSQIKLEESLKYLDTAKIMTTPPGIPAHTPLIVVKNTIWMLKTPMISVEEGGKTLGVIHIKAWPRGNVVHAQNAQAWQIMTDIAKIPIGYLSESPIEILEKMNDEQIHVVAIMDKTRERVLGFVEESNVEKILEYLHFFK